MGVDAAYYSETARPPSARLPAPRLRLGGGAFVVTPPTGGMRLSDASSVYAAAHPSTPPILTRFDVSEPSAPLQPSADSRPNAHVEEPADCEFGERADVIAEEPPAAPGGSAAADDHATAASLFRELEQPRETIPQLAAIVSDMLAANRSLPVDAIQQRVQQLVTRGSAAQRRTVNLVVEFGCWLLSEMAAHVIHDVSAAYSTLDPTPFPAVALCFYARPHLRRFAAGDNDFLEDVGDAEAPLTISDSDDDDAGGIPFSSVFDTD